MLIYIRNFLYKLIICFISNYKNITIEDLVWQKYKLKLCVFKIIIKKSKSFMYKILEPRRLITIMDSVSSKWTTIDSNLKLPKPNDIICLFSN